MGEWWRQAATRVGNAGPSSESSGTQGKEQLLVFILEWGLFNKIYPVVYVSMWPKCKENRI